MDPGSIVGMIGGLVMLVSIPVIWVWKLSKWDSKIAIIPGLTDDLKSTQKQTEENKLKIERLQTMVEPFWETICKNLPGILQFHTSPDPLEKALNGEATEEEMRKLLERTEKELNGVRGRNPTRALALSFAVWALKVKISGVIGCPKTGGEL